ncbi:MAG: thioredoxin family protein [Ignavibacteriales bacterium]|nr:thioredoxin family protein [Ignavibacteriales bacterium]
MALLESVDIPLGTPIEHFVLHDPFEKTHDSRRIFGRKGLLVVITCNHCPYAIAVWPRVIRIAEVAKRLGIETVAINPNINPAYPDDAPGQMKKKIAEWKIPFPYLVDETQAVARSFKAQCTPDIYLFGPAQTLVYHGRIDDNWQDESKVTQRELKEAVLALAAGKPVAEKQYHSMGCSIKWRS